MYVRDVSVRCLRVYLFRRMSMAVALCLCGVLVCFGVCLSLLLQVSRPLCLVYIWWCLLHCYCRVWLRVGLHRAFTGIFLICNQYCYPRHK